MRVDLKSMLLGMALTFLLILSTCQTNSNQSVGRYQIVTESNQGGMAAFLLDTKTGLTYIFGLQDKWSWVFLPVDTLSEREYLNKLRTLKQLKDLK